MLPPTKRTHSDIIQNLLVATQKIKVIGKIIQNWGFPGSPMVRTLHFTAGSMV